MRSKAWDRELAPHKDIGSGTLAKIAGAEAGETALDAWTVFVKDNDPSRLRRTLEILVDKFPLTPDATRLFAEAGRPTTPTMA